MSSDIDFGTRDEKGHWKPPYPAGFSPVFSRPIRPLRIIKWLLGWGGYIFPMYLFYAALAWATWTYLQPAAERFVNIDIGLILIMLGRNLGFAVIVYGTYHLLLYRWKIHGNRQKFHPDWQQKSKKFLFGNQVYDNVFYTLVSGVPIWTAYEILYFRLLATDSIPWLRYADSPLWFVVLFLIVPLWRETHFYFIHRLIHWKPLLRAVHSVHHRNPNPGPWSGLSMHPVEHLLYFSQLLIHIVVPSHPIHLLFNAQITALSPARGHIGFEGPLFNGAWPTGDYYHYLHHKYVSCNFGTGLIPWDRWLGRYYDGEGPYRTPTKKRTK